MNTQTPRLRMFAGPNGSGKSTLKSVLDPELLGVYINPDEIEKQIKTDNHLDITTFNVQTHAKEILGFFQQSTLIQKSGLAKLAAQLSFEDQKLIFTGITVNSYFASVAADFLRVKLMEKKFTITLETVMSSPQKINLLEQARISGYRTYLYYVATNDPSINISRVSNRVAQGGHDVPKEKIITRYHRSLDLLFEAIKHTDRAYLFDNSTPNANKQLIAEVTSGRTLKICTNSIPFWFKRAVIDKLS
jgi:predicted ABC-type ATPase